LGAASLQQGNNRILSQTMEAEPGLFDSSKGLMHHRPSPHCVKLINSEGFADTF
jgi:hypothetical protein